MSSLRPALAALLPLLALLAPAARAQEFAAVVSPPRFEDRIAPGKTYRNVIEINNVSSRAATYSIATADWQLEADGAPRFDSALAPGSCRPWVGIEAAQLTVPGGGKRRYRFEVAVPADAPRGECRFAIMIEGEPQIVGGGLPLPVSGRIGVIVYLAIGEAAPRLQLIETRSAQVAGQRVPVLRLRNDGDMHGRLEGFVDAVDASGQRWLLVPDNSPILPGAQRDIALMPQAENGAAAPTLRFPLKLDGRLDIGAQQLRIDTTVGGDDARE